MGPYNFGVGGVGPNFGLGGMCRDFGMGGMGGMGSWKFGMGGVGRNFYVWRWCPRLKNDVRQQSGMGLNILLFNHTLQKTLFSLEYDFMVPTEFNKLFFAKRYLHCTSFFQLKPTCVWCIFRFLDSHLSPLGPRQNNLSNPEAYSEPCQTYNTECLAKIVNG